MYARKRSFCLLLLSALPLLLLTGCLGVNLDTNFNGDGSGRIVMKLRISQELLQMGEEQGTSPIPLTKEDLEASYQDVPGVKVESVTEESAGSDKVITAVISFKDFAAFKSTKDLAGAGASLVVDPSGKTTYSVTIGEPLDTPVSSALATAGSSEATDQSTQDSRQSDEAVHAALAGLMEGYALEYSVTAPRKIISHSLGDLSSDGRTVSYSIAIADYVELPTPPTLEVVW